MVFIPHWPSRVGQGGMSVFSLLSNTRTKRPKYVLGYDGQHPGSLEQRTNCSGVYMP